MNREQERIHLILEQRNRFRRAAHHRIHRPQAHRRHCLVMALGTVPALDQRRARTRSTAHLRHRHAHHRCGRQVSTDSAYEELIFERAQEIQDLWDCDYENALSRARIELGRRAK